MNKFKHFEKSGPAHFSNSISGIMDDLPQVQWTGLTPASQRTKLSIGYSTWTNKNPAKRKKFFNYKILVPTTSYRWLTSEAYNLLWIT